MNRYQSLQETVRIMAEHGQVTLSGALFDGNTIIKLNPEMKHISLEQMLDDFVKRYPATTTCGGSGAGCIRLATTVRWVLPEGRHDAGRARAPGPASANILQGPTTAAGNFTMAKKVLKKEMEVLFSVNGAANLLEKDRQTLATTTSGSGCAR